MCIPVMATKFSRNPHLEVRIQGGSRPTKLSQARHGSGHNHKVIYDYHRGVIHEPLWTKKMLSIHVSVATDI